LHRLYSKSLQIAASRRKSRLKPVKPVKQTLIFACNNAPKKKNPNKKLDEDKDGGY